MEQDDAKNNDENVVVWEKRAILMVAFGLSGFGTLLGAISVYVRYLKHKIASHFHIKSFNISQIRESTVSDNADSEGISRRSSLRSPKDDDSRRASDNIGPTNVIIPSTLTGSIQGYEDLRPDEPPEGVSGSKTDEIQDFFGKVDELFRGSSGDQHEAYNILKANSDKLKEVPDYWWRFAKAAHLEAEVAEHQQDTESQKTLLLNAVAYAERAMKLDDNSADAHKWYAITQGSRGQFLKISERIQNGFIFKTHIDRAVELNPHDSTLHHLLGRFCFEVSQLSWVERRMAATLFSEPPTATIQEALNHFINAEKKGTPSLENRYYIAKCYITMSDNRNAAYWLNQASQVPVETPSVRDKKVLTALNKDLAKYRKYL